MRSGSEQESAELDQGRRRKTDLARAEGKEQVGQGREAKEALDHGERRGTEWTRAEGETRPGLRRRMMKLDKGQIK